MDGQIGHSKALSSGRISHGRVEMVQLALSSTRLLIQACSKQITCCDGDVVVLCFRSDRGCHTSGLDPPSGARPLSAGWTLCSAAALGV